MGAWIALALLVVAGLALLLRADAGSIAGYDPSDFAIAVAGLAMLIFVVTSIAGSYRGRLNQAARELLLAQSSDWAFIMKTGSHVEYAVKRTRDHILRFTKLYDDIRGNRVDDARLTDIEYRDNLFPHIDYRVYA